MRESIGGAWLFGIVITFIALFSGFLAYSVSYTRAFNVKNQIINYIEHAQGFTTSKVSVEADKDLANNKSVEGKAFYLIKNTGYNYEVLDDYVGTKTLCATVKDNISYNGVMQKGGYCVVKICQDKTNNSANTQYKVTTFIALEIPIIGFTVRIPISGETSTLYRDVGKFDCSN